MSKPQPKIPQIQRDPKLTPPTQHANEQQFAFEKKGEEPCQEPFT
jgi:hypothetical protein